MRKLQSIAPVRTVLMAAGIWALAAILAIPDAVTSHVSSQEVPCDDLMYCHLYAGWGSWYIYLHVLLQLFIYFPIPLTTIGAFYLLMANVLFHSYREMPGNNSTSMSQQVQKQLEARKKVAKVVLSFVAIFIICWLPRYIYFV